MKSRPGIAHLKNNFSFYHFREQKRELVQANFSTRTRLKPGGPASHQSRGSTSTLADRSSSSSSTRRPGSVMSNFEEVGMRSMTSKKRNFVRRPPPPNETTDFESFSNTLLTGGHNLAFHLPRTPIVKQRTPNSPGNHLANLPASVQMYRTRVVYSDSRPSSGAGLMNLEAAVWGALTVAFLHRPPRFVLNKSRSMRCWHSRSGFSCTVVDQVWTWTGRKFRKSWTGQKIFDSVWLNSQIVWGKRQRHFLNTTRIPQRLRGIERSNKNEAKKKEKVNRNKR